MMYELLQGCRVLLIAPHCDDEVLGCGGLLLSTARALKHLSLVHVVAPLGDREAEFEKVRAALEVDSYATLSGIDGMCSDMISPCVAELTRHIQKVRPNVVLAPHHADDHEDHKATWRIMREAVKRARYSVNESTAETHRVDLVLGYEVWTPIQTPSFLQDITPVFQQKRDLVNEYGSQQSEFPYADYIAALNGWRGMLWQKSGFAEAFEAHAVI